MFSALNKKLLWTIVIWFAILQAVSPFIHAHVEADTSKLGHGLHMHMQEIVPVYDTTPTLKNLAGSLHTIGVDKALVNGLGLLALLLPLFAVLFVLCSLTVVRQLSKTGFNFLTLHPFYLRPQSRPRAPPLY